MKKINFFIAFFLAIFLLSSCSKTISRYVNNSFNNSINQTQVVLNQANFKVVKTISASVEYESLIKSKYRDQLKESAYAQLLKNANLTGSQTIINVTFEQVETANTKGDHSVLINCTGVVIEFTK